MELLLVNIQLLILTVISMGLVLLHQRPMIISLGVRANNDVVLTLAPDINAYVIITKLIQIKLYQMRIY